jgi:hypothetical protein
MLTFIIILVVVFLFGYYLFKGIALLLFGGYKEDSYTSSKDTYITKHYHDNRSVHFHDTNQPTKNQKHFRR